MDVIRPYLYGAKIIDEHMLDRLNEMNKPQQRERLLTILSQSGVEGLVKFRKALKETSSSHIGHRDVVQKLEENPEFQRLMSKHIYKS